VNRSGGQLPFFTRNPHFDSQVASFERWTRTADNSTTLRLAAQSVGRTNTCLGIFYRRKKSHLGPAKATTATARKLACLIYHLLKYKDQYREPDPVTYQLKLEKTILHRLQKQAALLGYKLLPSALVPA
jgi:transposase